MPELPEVETVATDLDRYLKGKTISSVRVVGTHKLLETAPAAFRKAVVGKKVKRIFRRAKMVVIDLGSDTIVIHLKMTGQLIYVLKQPLVAGGHPITSTGVTVPNKFTRVVFGFTNGGSLYFNDLRKFGWIRLMSAEEFADLDQKTGLEPLGRGFSRTFFKNMLSRRQRTPIKAALLDQTHLVGLGNIYVDEVLFRSKVLPTRSVASLKPADIEAIFKSVTAVLKQAIKQRGTTFSNFLDPDGLRGNFVSHLKVYGRQGRPCLDCGTPVKKIRTAGRGTHFCPRCQQ